MTAIGKLLVFANLVFGVGAAIWATAVYTQRPGWFEPVPPEGAPKGASFAALGAELDTLGKAATSAGAAWSTQYGRLTKAEETRAVRLAKMFGDSQTKTRGLLAVARTGGLPGAKDKDAAFFNLKDEAGGKLLDLDPKADEKGAVVLGPDGKTLRGADTLLDRFNADAKEIGRVAEESLRLRKEQQKLGDQVGVEEARVLTQRGIRENLRQEGAALASVEVNAAGRLDWARSRKAQLDRRLEAFRKKD